jgi:DNA-binding protein H-NS
MSKRYYPCGRYTGAAMTIEKEFQALDLDGMNEVLERLTAIRDEAVEAKRADLLAQLEALGGVPASRKKTVRTTDGRSSPKPKYRSKKNPALTWAGRGQKPKWLVAEMAESKKPLDAFSVN